MSEYKPTEYIVDFGDSRSNRFVRLNMALIEQNSARLHERIVRCRDCKHAIPVTSDPPWLDCTGPLVETWDWQHDEPRINPVEPEGFCKWAERRDA